MKTFVKALVPAAAALAIVATWSSGTVVAQDAMEEEREPGPLVGIGEDIWRSGLSCWDCHGNMANGRNEDPRSPQGADLRTMLLNTEQIAQVIRCGRPGTPMPFFGRNAYEGDNACFGVTLEALGDQAPPIGDETLNTRQIDALSQFITFQFVGAGPVTQENCRAFFGEDASSCDRWPTEAELAAEAAEGAGD